MNKGTCLLDTGPLVSFLASGEPVLTEAAFLLKRGGRDAEALFELLERGVIRIALAVEEERGDLRALMHRYRSRPMSLADACVVRMAEIHEDHSVLTLDSDFTVYRKHGRVPIPVMHTAIPTD